MTLQYLATARLNAVPRREHIEQPEPPQPVYTCMDTLIADMKADAEAIRKRNAAIAQTKIVAKTISDEEIFQAIRENPGIIMGDLSKLISQSREGLRARLLNMEARGQVKVERFKNPTTNRMTRRFFPVKNPPKTLNGRRPSPKRDKMVAFIRANPGCTTVDIAQHIGVTVKHAGQALSEVRKVVNLRSERTPGAGNNAPARHWVLE